MKLYEAGTMKEIPEGHYFEKLLELYNQRNPHAMVRDLDDEEIAFEDTPPESDEG